MAEVRVQIKISRETRHGRFNDAVYLSLDEYEAVKDDPKAIEALGDARVSAWEASVDSAKNRVAEKPTRSELEEAKTRALAEVAEIDDRLARVDYKIAIVDGGR